MIQATREKNITARISTEENRISTSLAVTQIRFLCKFTNEMSGKVFYCYPEVKTINNRYTELKFLYNAAPNFYNNEIDLTYAGYYNYEVYEVSWIGTVGVTAGKAPATELDVLSPSASTRGVVQGVVAIGILYQSEFPSLEEVQYKQNGGHVITLDIAYEGVGYGATPPIVSFVGDCINTAKATATVLGGVVNTVTLTDAGNGYTANPTVVLTSVGETQKANIVASIQENNYIYTG